ncbi:pyridoxine 5'-phosphate synthase [candidate division CSSED10-310 bacterium]|uniref:Pyridoxine 5'-phosphate synthase n=1 Tax=candidate division CSSED10-310 bacterium TaxID=2855610 RepID=A0ABV6YRQ0_UNCC1
MTTLGVNLDHIATIREARKTNEPDPVLGAYIIELAGAHGVTIHLREDRRHIQDRDLHLFRKVVTKLKLNLEMATTDEMLAMATDIMPDQVTLVPEKRAEITTEGGLDIINHGQTVQNAVNTLKKVGIETSLFIDPYPEIIRQAKKLGADAIELHTGEYAAAKDFVSQKQELRKLQENATLGAELGLIVLAGHGLTYQNVTPVSVIIEVQELNIGHSIISRAVYVGLERAIREMLALLKG